MWSYKVNRQSKITWFFIGITCGLLQIPVLTSYLSFGFLSPMIVLIDVNLSHLFVFLLHLFPFCRLGVNFIAHAHPFHAQNIEREWISLTCTWLVVWGRVQIRLQRRPSVKL